MQIIAGPATGGFGLSLRQYWPPLIAVIVQLNVIVMMMPLMVLMVSVGAGRGTETSSDPER
jgi:hypothetical protein